jgi:fatty acid desaturase
MELETNAMQGMDREALRRLSRRSNARGLVQLGLHAALIGATGTLVWASRGHGWLPAAVILHGLVLNFVFCALHESVHRTAFASRRINDAVAWICGAILMLPAEYFRLFHFTHHRFTQDPARDPELAQPPPATLAGYLWRASGIPNWYKRLTITLRHALTGRVTEPFIPPAKAGLIVREARILWSCYAAIFLLSLALRRDDALVYWVLPVMAGQPFLRLFLFSEHSGCAMSDDMYANTRTTYTNDAVRLLTWQMSFHVEHHAFPAVPFHALAQVNALIRDRIEISAPGYLALHCAMIRRFLSYGRGASSTLRGSSANSRR